MAKHPPKSETTPKNGRPPKFETGEAIIDAANIYFVYCRDEKKAPNKAGLRLSLDISIDTYSEYRKRFPEAINKLDAEIETWWVDRLQHANATGAIFYLKAAMGWKDQQAIDITTGGQPISGMTISKA